MIIERSLNYLRKEYPLSYVGLRALLDNIYPDARKDWISSYVSRKAVRKSQNFYRSFPSFRKFSASGEPVYRTFFAPSPTTMLYEANLLKKLESIPDFWGSERVFSYRKPEGSDSPHVFEPFIKGYRKRNETILQHLMQNKGHIAHILDIESFYDNVVRATVLRDARAFMKRYISSDKETTKDFEWGVDCLFEAGGEGNERGLPIGSAISHLLGNVALRTVDDAFIKSGQYFRYVDDITFVGTAEECRIMRDNANNILRESGLNLNESKEDVVDFHQIYVAQTWSSSRIILDGFNEIILRLAALNMRSYMLADSVQKSLQTEGFFFPVAQINYLSSYKRFYRWVKFIVRQIAADSVFEKRSHSLSWYLSNDTAKTIISHANELKDALMTEALAIHHSQIPERGTVRKMFVQRCRCVFNKLVYLADPSDFFYMIPRIDELAEIRSVSIFLGKHDLENIGKYPCAASRVSAEILSHRSVIISAGEFNDTALLNDSMTESMIIFALWGSLWQNKRSCGGDFVASLASKRNIDGFDMFSYEAELKSLIFRMDNNETARYFRELYSDNEKFVFQGSLLDGYYSGL